LYLGENEPEMMVQNVFRFSLYADQILIVNPFLNPNVLANPGISDEEVKNVLDDIERDRAEDPLLLNETIDRMPAQNMVANLGANLEMGLYICQATGSLPYTNVKFRWREILAAKQELDVTAQTWSPLTNAYQQLTFKFLDQVDSGFACTLRKEGWLEGFRSYLRKLWTTVGGEADVAKAEPLVKPTTTPKRSGARSTGICSSGPRPP
jgi:hypothetical protein